MQSASAAVLNSPASAYVYIPRQRILVEPSSCFSSYAPPLRASKFFGGGARSLGRRQNHPGQRPFPGFRIDLVKDSRKLVVKAVASPHSAIELPLTAENVESILDEIRPYLIADGGNVALHEINGNVVKLKLQGRNSETARKNPSNCRSTAPAVEDFCLYIHKKFSVHLGSY